VIRALAYIELQYAKHQCAAVLRSPLRLALWLPYLISIGYIAFLRLNSRHHTAFLTVGVQHPRFATVAGGLYLGTVGIVAGLAAAGRVAAFRTSAEAVLFSNAGIRPLAIALWLQLRKLAMGSLRWFASLAYVFVVAAPAHASGATLARALLGAMLAVGVVMSCELPAFLLARRLHFPIQMLGWALALFGFGFAIAAVLGPRFRTPLIEATRVDPGTFAAALLDGGTRPLLLLAAVLAISVASMLALANDAIPELYAATQRTLAVRSNRRRFANETTFDVRDAGVAARVPAGALALIWKDWVAFRRGRGTLRLWLFGAAFWTLCGAGVAVASMRYDDPTPLLSLAAMSATIVFLSAPFGASVGLAADLGKPLFWLSRTPLRARIAAWTFARAWRGGTAIALGPLAAGIVSGDAALALTALPLSLTTYWSLQALGVGLYAVFPNPIDARGPMMLLRMLLTGLYVVPALAVAALAGAFELGPLASALGFALALALEGWLVVEAASYRFREHGASLATLSRAT
jgi:hypothetical protein